MIKVSRLKYFYQVFLLFCLLSSYFLFQIFYDSSTGLDFGNKYVNFIEYFVFNKSFYPFDGQNVFYYYFISTLINLNSDLIGPYNLNEIFNYSIQLGNFILQIVSFIGIYKFYKFMGVKKESLILLLSFLCFFPPLIYLRLTFKSEMLALAIFPWVLYFYEVLKKSKNLNIQILFVLSTTALLTIKPAVTGMVLICLFFYVYKNFKDFKKEIIFISFLSFIILLINQSIVGLNFFSHNDFNTDYKWEYVATYDFFFSFNIKSLITEPFFNKQSGSLLSILLIDTFSDYFTFFWKHKESTNYLAMNFVEVSNNFFVSRYLRDYISIFTTLIIYISTIYFYFNSKSKSRHLLIFFYAGLAILVINSLGIPSKNFNPTTADTFKVHYFSFLLVLSISELFLTNRKTKVALTLLVPVFIFIMGFPKENMTKYSLHLNDKINLSEVCYLVNFKDLDNCRNQFLTTCKDSSNNLFSRNNYFYYIEPILLTSQNEKKIYVTNSGDCFKYLNNGFTFDLNYH